MYAHALGQSCKKKSCMRIIELTEIKIVIIQGQGLKFAEMLDLDFYLNIETLNIF